MHSSPVEKALPLLQSLNPTNILSKCFLVEGQLLTVEHNSTKFLQDFSLETTCANPELKIEHVVRDWYAHTQSQSHAAQ